MSQTSCAIAIDFIRDAIALGSTARQAARSFRSTHPRIFFDVLDAIGAWPSSEPELRAIQTCDEREVRS
jgi:hypothetical protein